MILTSPVRRALLLALLLPACGPRDPVATAGGLETPALAARALVATLRDSVRAAAVFPLEGAERRRWAYVPQPRDGLPLRRMEPRERDATLRLLRTALSEQGFRRASGIIRHEETLRALEQGAGVAGWERRDPTLYYLSLFGEPSPDSVWGWRFEGHHLSVNVTSTGRGPQVVAPLFMGANPARVPSGPRAGVRLLAEEEDLARALLLSLGEGQRGRALIAAASPGDVVTRNDPVVRPMARAGLPASAMTGPQREQLRRLLELYARRMAPAAAADQLERIERAGFDSLHFAWAGSAEPGRAHYYRIHGPTVLVEYDNSQNDANHVHTVWRDLERDFGGDPLRRHYAQHPHR